MGRGGFNGAANGGAPPSGSGGGGGASDVREGGSALENRVIVAEGSAIGGTNIRGAHLPASGGNDDVITISW